MTKTVVQDEKKKSNNKRFYVLFCMQLATTQVYTEQFHG